MNIGLVIKKGSSIAKSLAIEVIDFFRKNNHEIFFEESLKGEFQGRYFSLEQPDVDYLVVIGGDGTLFRTLHKLRNLNIPILTIKAGRKGFILDIEPYEVKERLKDFLQGNYFIKEYFRLNISINGEQKVPPAANDVIIATTGRYRTKVGRLIVLRDTYPIYCIDGDGVIVATPLGSTAYSLSAGGPVLDHDLEGMVITPLASVQLGVRPIVFPLNAKVTIKIRSDSPPLMLSVDGQVNIDVLPNSTVTIVRDNLTFKLIRFKKGWLYERLTTKIM